MPQRIRWAGELMQVQELELHSRQRLGTSHQDGILVWGHFDRDGGRGNRMGAHLFASDCCVTRGDQGQVGRPRRDETSSAIQSAVRPVRDWAVLRWLNKSAGCCRVGDTNNVNVTLGERVCVQGRTHTHAHKRRDGQAWTGVEEAGTGTDGRGRREARREGEAVKLVS